MDELDAFGVLREEPMRKHTSWRVGGPAELFFEPSDEEVLARFLASLPEEMPVHFVGLGSNLLVRDGGVRGAVIGTRRLPKRLERLDPLRVSAGAGVPCARLARQCVRWNLGPAAFFAGIPGTVGGALAMNAGAFGGETWDRVESVETLDRHGVRRTHARDEFAIGYRSVRMKKGSVEKEGSEPFFAATPESATSAAKKGSGPFFSTHPFFISAAFAFERDDTLDESSIKTMLEKRAATQPLGVPSCGSVFRNPEGTHAGALIEGAGLKGLRIGGAEVSGKHANFIVNTGDATAEDIERLIETVKQRVAALTGVNLVLEARVIGERRAETQ